jgi:hypothetical protein
MAIARVAHASVANTGSSTATTSAIDTTGATLLVVLTDSRGSSSTTHVVTDSQGNTWHSLHIAHGSDSWLTLHYSFDHGGSALSVGSGHTITVTTASAPFYISAVFASYSGTDTTSAVFDQENWNNTNEEWLQTPGSVTPAVNGSLIVAGCVSSYAIPTIYSSSYGFADVDGADPGGDWAAIGLADLIQTTAAAVNPQFSLGGHYGDCANIAVFKAASGASSSLSTINGLVKASVKTVDGLAVASVKSWGGLA